jgi:hypothetical protein
MFDDSPADRSHDQLTVLIRCVPPSGDVSTGQLTFLQLDNHNAAVPEHSINGCAVHFS